jgi:hypothetical protein
VTHAQSYDGGMESKHVREVGSGHHSPIHPHKTIKPLPNTCRNARLNPTHVRHEISNHHRCSTTQTIARSDSLDRSGKNKRFLLSTTHFAEIDLSRKPTLGGGLEALQHASLALVLLFPPRTISARRLVSHNTLNISRELSSKYTCKLSNLHDK